MEDKEVGQLNREKRPRVSSSDSETEKPPTKMANNNNKEDKIDESTEEPTNGELKLLLLQIRNDQQGLQKLVDTKLEELKGQLVKIVEDKFNEVTAKLDREMGQMNERMDELETRLSGLEDQRTGANNTEGVASAIKRLEYKAIDQEARA